MKIVNTVRSRGRLTFAAALLAAGALVLSACGSSGTGNTSTSSGASSSSETSSRTSQSESTSSAGGSTESSTTGESNASPPANLGLMTPGKLVVGMNLQFKPEMYLDDAGKPAGYDVDLLNALAKSLNVTLDIQNLDFNGLIPGLQSKKFDMVSVGLNATPERQKVVDFSRPYVPYVQVLAVKSDDTTTPTLDSWNKAGVTITALQGSSAEALAQKTFSKAKVATFPDQNAALLEVASGRAQGSVVEDYILAQFNQANGNALKAAALDKPLDVNYGAWAVQKGNTGLVDALNTFLCTAQSDGTLAKLYEKNQGVKDFPPMPGGC